ncbi:MAG: pyrroline-5-carboxylate reductase [Bacteroidota bacterium]|jgi:pyrroline-5-carboxylate reductase
MKITIIGGGNMGSAIALGLASGSNIKASDITVIDRAESTSALIKKQNNAINAVINDYSSLKEADIVILCVKPWLIQEVLTTYKDHLHSQQILLSIAAGISLEQLATWSFDDAPIYRVIPNTAIAIKQSMTFVASVNTTPEQDQMILKLFDEVGKTMLIDEKLVAAVTSLSSCGIAFAFRYIRAAIEGGVEMGIYPNQGRDILIQTLRGAIDLLEANDSHPEAEIDKVTTPGGITIKGINEMEHAGFTSAVIRGLKASYIR